MMTWGICKVFLAHKGSVCHRLTEVSLRRYLVYITISWTSMATELEPDQEAKAEAKGVTTQTLERIPCSTQRCWQISESKPERLNGCQIQFIIPFIA